MSTQRVVCPFGCTCGRHRTQKCEVGCTCNRHQRAHNKYTEEQRAEALERKRAIGRAYMKARRAADPERARQLAREQYAKNGRKHNLRWKFGMSPEDLEALRESQDGKCFLCERPLPEKTHIDHDRSHCSGNKGCPTCVRGIACQTCNQGIGQFGDDPERLRLVADNLERANKRVRS